MARPGRRRPTLSALSPRARRPEVEAQYASTTPVAPLPVPEARPWALAFIVVVILALAGLPIVTSRQISSSDAQISEVLEPARSKAADLALVQARQMLRFREYLLTGDTDAKVIYQALVPREDSIRGELFSLLDRMSLANQQSALPVVDASFEWHRSHRSALESDSARRAYLPLAEEDQARYELMLLNSQTFRDRLAEETRNARANVEAARTLQIRLTIVLLVLALLATVAVGLVGRRLRGIIKEVNVRRHDAVRARWEIDAVLEATGDGVLGIDLEGRILTLNATGTRLLGFTDEEARGRSVHDLLHGAASDAEGHSASECPLLISLRKGGAAEQVDDTAWHRRGRGFPVRWSLRPLMDGLVVRGAVVTVTDMTEIREAERALRQAVRARDETMAVVSHDLRNPIGSIAAAAELLLEVPLDEDKTRRQLRTIQKAAERSNVLIDDLLDVARIDAGGLSVRAAPCPVRPLLEEAVALASPLALDRDLALGFRVQGDTPPILADRNRMIQVLGNLISNAIRHTPSGGRIEVSARPRDEGWVAIAVHDTGYGIAAQDRAHLFDRFWRRDRTERGGAGLGLAIVKGIVEAHGGHVDVESEVGAGSTFTVVLPTVGSTAAREGPGHRATTPGERPGSS